MVFSPLTTTTASTSKYGSRNGLKVSRLIIHYTAGGTDTSNVTLLSGADDGRRQVSATYVCRRDGTLVGIVPEEYRPWTSGSFTADGPSVTVETVIAPKGEATPAQLETLSRLAADLSTRYGWGALNRSNVRGHREFANTDCPGPYLWPRMNQIVEHANQILAGNTTKPAPAPVPGGDTDTLARAVIRGVYGNGEQRRNRLGARYSEVQARVNQILAGNSQASKPAPPNIDALADAVIRGEYDNGPERKRRLGNLYHQVQARVNQKLGYH